jgi:sec-independent protein translocase protein TatB
MFDFSFSEIALIGAVALVVIGPERLPRVARTAGVVLGRVQRYAAAVRADIAREVELSELRRVQSDLQEASKSLESSMQGLKSEIHTSLADASAQFETTKEKVMTVEAEANRVEEPLPTNTKNKPLPVFEPTQQDLDLEVHEVAAHPKSIQQADHSEHSV